MPSTPNCPTCGTHLPDDVPEGLCPACLFKAGLDGMSDQIDASSSLSGSVHRRPASPNAGIAPGDAPGITLMSPRSRVRYFGDYEFREELDEIAHGGMGVVYRARQISLDRVVALKMILPARLDEDAIRRFRQEVESAANLDHPNIVPVFEFGQHEGQYFYSMKLIEGRSLADELPRFQEDSRTAACLMATIARAVHYAHQRGVLHRDLKPQNILVDRDGQPHVTDFGLAKRMEAGRELTHTGDWAGTPDYVSPEQRAGEFKNLTTAADIYSLGAIFYALLTGHPPFHGPKSKIPWMDLPDEPARPRSLDPRIDVDLETICLKCLDEDPNRRYPTAAALADDLDRWLGGEPITARPVSSWERALKWARRKPAIAALVLVAVLGVAGIAWQWRQAVKNAALARTNEGLAKSALNDVTTANNDLRAALDTRDKALELARLNAYIAHMRLAQREWESANVGRVLELLEEERPKGTDRSDLRGFEWFYWNRLCHSERLTLEGHTGSMESVAFSPDGKRLASASYRGTVKVWDAASGQETLTLKGHLGSRNSVAFSPDGKRLALASGDIDSGELKVWDAATGQEALTLKGHTRGVNSVAFSPDGKRLASASHDWTVKVWDATSGQETLTLKGHTSGVDSVAFSPDGKRLASASSDGTVKVWDAASGQETLTLKGHTCVAFSPDGKPLASADHDGTVKVWDADSGQEALTLKGHTNGVNSVAFSPDDKRLASASWDQTVKVWDAATGQEALTLKGHTDGVKGVAFSPDGTQLASASEDGTVKVWDAAGGQESLTLKGHTSVVRSVAFSPDGTRLASASLDETVKVWDAASGQETLTLKGHPGSGNSVAFSPDGTRLALGSLDRTVKVWDLASGQGALTLKGHKDWVHGVAFSPDGKRLASASHDWTVKVWDAASGQETLTLKGHTSVVNSVAFSPDGKRLASASSDRTVKVWDAATGQEALTLKGHTDFVDSVAFSPDGTRLASASWDQTAKLWDAAGGQEALTLKGHTGIVCSVAFSPVGTQLASASEDGTVKLWDAATGQETLTLKGHTDGVNGVTFSPDGTRLASASRDHTVKVWDASDRP